MALCTKLRPSALQWEMSHNYVPEEYSHTWEMGSLSIKRKTEGGQSIKYKEVSQMHREAIM